MKVGGQAGSMRGPSSFQEYLHNYTWEVFQLFGDSQTLLVNAKDITPPAFTVDIENQQGSALRYKFAKSVSYDDVKIVFYDVVGLIKIVKRWRETVWTPGTGLKLANDYKKESRINIYSPTWEPKDGYSWILKGSWPSVIRHGDLTYTSSDVKVVEVTVTYDWAEETTSVE
jgi:hypothetical protein